VPDITERQKQVITGLAEGKSAREVAEDLGVGVGTVEQHRHLAYKALGIRSIVDLVKYALAQGWVRNPYQRGRPRKAR
jgi:DNA-binding NarL/FixJ family response regulator